MVVSLKVLSQYMLSSIATPTIRACRAACFLHQLCSNIAYVWSSSGVCCATMCGHHLVCVLCLLQEHNGLCVQVTCYDYVCLSYKQL